MKVSKILAAAAMVCLALIAMVSPMSYAGAQGGQSTPSIVIVTATPVGGSAPAAEPTAAAPVSGEATAEPREWKAFNLARQALTKKIGKNLRYVTSYTYDLLLFPDSDLGCAVSGSTPVKGDTAGYKITIQPLGEATVYEYRVSFDLTKVVDCGQAGSAQNASGTGPVTGTAAGGGFELGGHVYQLNGGTVNTMKSAKMKWVKFQVRPNDGGATGLIAQAKASGFKVLLSVVGSANDILGGDAYFDQYAAYVGNLAASGADAIEIWNEMNLDREWPNGQISPVNYVKLLSKSFNAIKTKNANTLVISGAPSPTGAAGAGGKTDAYWNDDVYYNELAAAGAGQYADCIGVHYNEGIVSPRQSSGDPRDSYPTRYFQTMLNRALAGFGGKQACFTELGYLSPEGYGTLPGGFAWAQNTTVAQQAQWLAEAAVLGAQSGRVRLMIVWNVDFPSFGGADPVGGYAITRVGGGCPACAQLSAVVP